MRYLIVLQFFAVAFCKNVKESIFNDSLILWDMYRDPLTGVYCDKIYIQSQVPCGPSNNFYSSAGTGMGLIIKTIMAEYGHSSFEQAESDVIHTLQTMVDDWPKDTHTGFLIHFTNRNWQIISEFSTIDSAELVLGALFAGNYFQGEVLQLANILRDSIDWSAAIKSATKPRIFSVVDPDTGTMGGNIKPYNEYYLNAYIAYIISTSPESKSAQHFETFWETDGGEPVGNGRKPVHKSYHGFDLLTDQAGAFMSGFIPQFCYFMSKSFQLNDFYSNQMFPAWLRADKLFYSLNIPQNATVWGMPIAGKVFGAGAGPGLSGYSVDRIDQSPDLIFSAAIMAGFLPAANETEFEEINEQLEWLYENDVCAYPLSFEGKQIKIVWRCSILQGNWQNPVVDSIDYSTFTLGYSLNFLPADFFLTYAA